MGTISQSRFPIRLSFIFHSFVPFTIPFFVAFLLAQKHFIPVLNGSIEVFRHFGSTSRNPLHSERRREWKIHFMKYGNLRETNFICVITKLGHIPSFELSPLYFMCFFPPSSSSSVCFYPKVYFVACTEQHTVKLIFQVGWLFSLTLIMYGCVCVCVGTGCMSSLYCKICGKIK